jgi:hypothetical protein
MHETLGSDFTANLNYDITVINVCGHTLDQTELVRLRPQVFNMLYI